MRNRFKIPYRRCMCIAMVLAVILSLVFVFTPGVFANTGSLSPGKAIDDGSVQQAAAAAAIAIPGTVEAENYSAMFGIQTESCSEGTLDVGWTDTGDWLDYTVNVANAGTYAVNARVASPNSGTSFKLQSGGTDLGTIAVPNTGGWQNWTSASTNVTLSAGVQTLRVYISAGGLNINKIDFTTVAPGLPDLIVTDISWNPANPAAGAAVTFSATIKNQGTGPTPAGVINGVAFQIDGAGTTLWSDNNTSSIPAGASVTVTVNGGTAGSIWTATQGTHSILAWVDDVNRMAESDKTNNTYRESITIGGGDVGGDVIGKLYAGYQGWFNCGGDGSPNNSWVHWTKDNNIPSANLNIKFEIYPDTREYTNLYQTNLGNLGNGQPAKLFSSYDASTVNKHFEWMQQYNIDGAALQRFGASASDSYDSWRANRDSVAVKVKNAAETYGRKFYIMYDITGMDSNTWVNAVEHDWTTNIINKMNLTASSAYARQDGKPVVCIWGIGFTDRPGDASQCASVINWFKNQGYYVIGGVPTYWRTGINDSRPGFIDVYKSLDMISPWLVGRFGSLNDADNFKNNVIQPDYTYCQQNGIDYQPTMNPGFAWSNMNPDKPRNEAPRLHGDFMWRQAYNIKSIGISTGYIAMFDEYDEGTAIAKGAENSSMTPNNKYFLTYDADGVVCSSDFYLRLAGDINRLLKGQIPLTTNHPTSHTLN